MVSGMVAFRQIECRGNSKFRQVSQVIVKGCGGDFRFCVDARARLNSRMTLDNRLEPTQWQCFDVEIFADMRSIRYTFESPITGETRLACHTN
jgi:hypothetical protein